MHSRRVLWILSVALASLSARALSAAVYTCSGGDANCLRNAVYSANATPGADTILLYPGTYTLSSWLTCISASVGCDALGPVQGTLTVIGAGRDATILQPDPNFPPMRIFDVPSGAFLTVCNLTIRGVQSHGNPWDPSYGGLGVLNAGRVMLTEVAIRDNELDDGPGAGAGIRNDPTGVLYMSNSIVSGNKEGSSSGGAPGGAGILNDGALTIVSSSIAGNSTPFLGGIGAGLLNRGSATVQNSTISGNDAGQTAGGGIFATGTLTIESSSITGNSAGGNGDEPVGGGGIFIAGNVSIRNTTVAQNRASGLGPVGAGIRVAAGGSLVLDGSTVADNRSFGVGDGRGGGIYDDGSAQIRNSIVARNTADDGAPPSHGPDCYGTLTSLGHNIIGDMTNCTITLQASDYVGDAKLGTFTDQIPAADGSLQGNGQIPLLVGSPAIDAGDSNACSTTDQVGYPRVDANLGCGQKCDIGAVEYAPVVNSWISLIGTTATRNLKHSIEYPAGTATVTQQYTNNVLSIGHPVFVLRSLASNAVLLNGDPANAGGVGARLTPNVGPDSIWSPGETITVTWVFGLKSGTGARFSADAVGFPDCP